MAEAGGTPPPSETTPEMTARGLDFPPRSQKAARKRRSTTARGYGRRHQVLRERWAKEVSAGTVMCARCDRFIDPEEPWDLGHDDNDRSKYIGPEHAACNRSAGGRAAHEVKRQSEDW